MNKFDLKLLRRIYALAKPYWISDQSRRAWALLAVLALLQTGNTWSNVHFNQQAGEFTSALAAYDSARFWRAIGVFLLLLLIAVPLYAFYEYVRTVLTIHWRRWLTDRMLERYFSGRAFYRLVGTPEIDNPDQRISQDVLDFTQQSLGYLLIFASALFDLVAFSAVLWSISGLLVLFLVGYAAVGTFVTARVFSGKMIGLYFERLRREADFRFGLMRVRENAESIAFYRGEGQERAQVQRRFAAVFDNFMRLIRWRLRLNLFTYTYSWLTLALPSVILAPRVLSGELEVGRVVQAAGAFSAVLTSLSVFVNNMEWLSGFAASAERLDAFVRQLDQPTSQPSGSERPRIATREGDELRFENVTLQTPNYERTLVRSLVARVPPGAGMLIVGPSGCGKSSLLRAIAGLWDAGSGTVVRPAIDQLLFLPQQAYMILGDLRSQLCYPYLNREASDAELRDVLARVNLPELVERCGGFDVEMDFHKVLSVGERQRLAFARAILHRPSYVLLDEATSALDPDNEARLYRLLASMSATFVSVSHHPSLLAYHAQVLSLTGDGDWTVSRA